MKKYTVSTTVRITYSRVIEANTRREAEEIAESMGEHGAHDATSGSPWKARLYKHETDAGIGPGSSMSVNYEEENLNSTEQLRWQYQQQIIKEEPKVKTYREQQDERERKCKGCRYHSMLIGCGTGSEWYQHRDLDSLSNASYPDGVDLSKRLPCYKPAEEPGKANTGAGAPAPKYTWDWEDGVYKVREVDGLGKGIPMLLQECTTKEAAEQVVKAWEGRDELEGDLNTELQPLLERLVDKYHGVLPEKEVLASVIDSVKAHLPGC